MKIGSQSRKYMNEKDLATLTTHIEKSFDDYFAKRLEPMMGEIATKKAQAIVDSMKQDRYLNDGKDITRLSEKQKKKKMFELE